MQTVAKLFNVHARAQLARGPNGAVDAVQLEDQFGGGEFPKEIVGFLAPEHAGHAWQPSDSSASPERFWFMLTKGSGDKEFGFCLRTFVQLPDTGAVVCRCEVVLSNYCWPAVMFALLEWQKKMFARAEHNKTPQTRHIFLHRIISSPLPAPGQASCERCVFASVDHSCVKGLQTESAR
jgi:hypothetical protein